MIETDEGIGSRKWSFGVDHSIEGKPRYSLCQGAIELAKFTPDGNDVRFLIVTAPQLWDAANEVVKFATEIAIKHNEFVNPKIVALGDMVAKAVGKQDWTKVQQA